MTRTNVDKRLGLSPPTTNLFFSSETLVIYWPKVAFITLRTIFITNVLLYILCVLLGQKLSRK